MSEEKSETKLPEGISKKLGPFPLWVWVVAGSAAIFAVLFIRGKSAPQPSAVGQAATRDPGTGITSPDPLTTEQLLQALNDLSSQLASYQGKQVAPGGTSGSQQAPPPGIPPEPYPPNPSSIQPPPIVQPPSWAPPPPPTWGPPPIIQPPALGANPDALGVVGLRANVYHPMDPLLQKEAAGGLSIFRSSLFAIASTHTMSGSSTARLSDAAPMRRSANSPLTARRPVRPLTQG